MRYEIQLMLAEEYIESVKKNAIYFKDGKFPNMPLYQESVIKDAFKEGINRVINSVPKLTWAKVFENNSYIAISPLGISYKIDISYDGEIRLYCNNTFINWYSCISEAQDAANKNYNKRIKQALGL